MPLHADTTMSASALTDTVSVILEALPHRIPVEVHEPLGAKDVGSWLVQLAVALGAACLGAWLGSRSTREASRQAMRDEAELERQSKLRFLLQRVRASLPRLEAIAGRLGEVGPDAPFPRDVAEELEVVWNLYHRLLEPIFALEDKELSEEIDDVFVKAHLLGAEVKALEDRWEAVPHNSDPYFGNVRRRIGSGRAAIATKIADLGNRAHALHEKLVLFDLTPPKPKRKSGRWG